MPAIEIEYPLAGAQLGLSFQAGGTYDLTLREKRPKQADGPVYIRCYLSRPDDDTVYQSDDFDTAAAVMGVWSVSFSLPPLAPGDYYTNCQLEAGFVSGGDYTEQQSVDGVNAGPQGDPLVPQPGGTIIIVLPPQGP